MITKQDIIENNKNIASIFELNYSPLVSIVICNRNGLDKLITLFESMASCNFYNNFEIIVVDNASTDESILYLDEQKENFNIKLVRNRQNETFSKACNQGAEIAKGEYLLFLNNDIEVTDYWLDELLRVAFLNENVGAVGARLIYPDIPKGAINYGKSYKAQHKGIAFHNQIFENKPYIRPYNKGNGDDPFIDEDEECIAISAVTAACLLIKKSVFYDIAGFDEHYVYGYEDVDLCLKAYRKGYTNYYCPKALLFHYEFGTQQSDVKDEVFLRRKNNLLYFSRRWQKFLGREILADKRENSHVFSEKPLTIAFAIKGNDTFNEDYSLALNFANVLNTRGISIEYLWSGTKNEWYNISNDTDILIVLSEEYNLFNMKCANPYIVTIGWVRKSVDKWCNNLSFQCYRFVFAASKIACEYIFTNSKRNAYYFPVATSYGKGCGVSNEEDTLKKLQYKADYILCDSYRKGIGEFLSWLSPKSYSFKFKLYGKNWEKVSSLIPFYSTKGNYFMDSDIYRYSKVLLHYATDEERIWGVSNSSVVDAIASGCLPLTNDHFVSESLFQGELPVYDNKDELDLLLKNYLCNEELRTKQVKKLQKIVSQFYTFGNRFEQLKSIIKCLGKQYSNKIAILTPVPKWEEAEWWGDYHFAVALKKCFKRRNFEVEIRILPDWDKPFDGKYVLVLRGLSKYIPQMIHFNIMWNLSHPDNIKLDEYDEYDINFISSDFWANYLEDKVKTHVVPLLQCTDTDVFTGESCEQSEKPDILFVGNTRGEYRKSIRYLLPTNHKLFVYGKGWEQYIDSKYIKGNVIPNKDLNYYYNNCGMLLNDHWEDMREKGFISNRIFDGLAAGAFVVTDSVKGMDSELKECLITYENETDFNTIIEYYLNRPDLRKMIALKGQELVRKKHTFQQRVDTMIDFLKKYTI